MTFLRGASSYLAPLGSKKKQGSSWLQAASDLVYSHCDLLRVIRRRRVTGGRVVDVCQLQGQVKQTHTKVQTNHTLEAAHDRSAGKPTPVVTDLTNLRRQSYGDIAHRRFYLRNAHPDHLISFRSVCVRYPKVFILRCPWVISLLYAYVLMTSIIFYVTSKLSINALYTCAPVSSDSGCHCIPKWPCPSIASITPSGAVAHTVNPSARRSMA